MLLLNNPYLNADSIIAELQLLKHKGNKQGINPIDILQKLIKGQLLSKRHVKQGCSTRIKHGSLYNILSFKIRFNHDF